MKSLLIANRGEIALRIMKSAKKLGLATVAVYSEADATAAHVAAADQAVCIGPPPARDSYLQAATILAAAERTGADAIHPGYGFLSENADFAESCAGAGLIFVGPPPSAIRAMGSKSAAKSLMQQAGVPLVPGYHGADQSPAVLADQAALIGFPILIKASAGGGGKGMKIVTAAEDLSDAIASAQRETQSSFGDATLLLEKYLTRPRHVEMQIFADQHGGLLHLFERDCSLQRRYQKVVEEAPAPFLTGRRRAEMAEAALGAARAVGYVGAGTVEFILEGEHFYFMEMNTRLQVEHPVTEAITGLDLVEWQLRVARGEALPLTQAEVRAQGHAVEVRLYAEDPDREFLPQTGLLQHVRWPQGVRVDSGVRQGDVVSRYYDPMLAKIIAFGPSRDDAIARLRQALAETEIVGLPTNRRFLQAILAHPAFIEGEIDTGFIPRHAAQLLAAPELDETLLALAALSVLRRAEQTNRQAADALDPHSPWGDLPGWRLNRDAFVDIVLGDHLLRAHYRADQYLLDLPSGPCSVSGVCGADGSVTARVGDLSLHGRAIFGQKSVTLFALGREARYALVDLFAAGDGDDVAGRLVAPMPGQVTKLFVAVGDVVEKGAPLIVIEAMKMEHVIQAPRRGKVAKLPFRVGDVVPDAMELLVLDDLPA